jgi:RNA polymerase sigma-70 factor, ECF subfamily
MSVELAFRGRAADAEDRLAIRCGSGETAAFDEIVGRYQLRLYRFAYRMLCDRGEAEDAVQETFVRAYRAIRGYRPDGFFSSWIYRIALNECRRRLRSRRPTVALDSTSLAAQGCDPQEAALLQERSRRVRQAVDALPEHYRMVMMLFYFDEMSVDQISRTVGVSVSAVKVRLHRGRERMAARLGVTL